MLQVVFAHMPKHTPSVSHSYQLHRHPQFKPLFHFHSTIPPSYLLPVYPPNPILNSISSISVRLYPNGFSAVAPHPHAPACTPWHGPEGLCQCETLPQPWLLRAETSTKLLRYPLPGHPWAPSTALLCQAPAGQTQLLPMTSQAGTRHISRTPFW